MFLERTRVKPILILCNLGNYQKSCSDIKYNSPVEIYAMSINFIYKSIIRKLQEQETKMAAHKYTKEGMKEMNMDRTIFFVAFTVDPEETLHSMPAQASK